MITLFTSLVVFYFLFSAIYLLVMVIASKNYRLKQNTVDNAANLRFLVVIPAYKEDAVILRTARNTIAQQYPKTDFEVLVIGDGLSADTLYQLRKMDCLLKEVSFEKSTKVKAIQEGLKKIRKKYDYTVLLDADNYIEPDFLSRLNKSIIPEKHQAIQLNRTAFNSEKGISFWDAFSEYSNNIIACEGPNALGLSSKFTGSGMVIHHPLFAFFMNQLDSISGFDKDMEIRFTEKKIYIHYFNHIKVFDEKVESSGQMAKQRGRWIFAQYDYLVKNFPAAFHSLFTSNLDHFHRVAQLALPPRFLGLIGLFLINLVCFLLDPWLLYTGLAAMMIYSGAYLWMLWEYAENPQILIRHLLKLPVLIITYLMALYYLPKARKQFLHTSHGSEPKPEKK